MAGVSLAVNGYKYRNSIPRKGDNEKSLFCFVFQRTEKYQMAKVKETTYFN